MDIEIGLSGREIWWESDIYRGFDISFLIVFLNFVSFFGYFVYFWGFIKEIGSFFGFSV